MKKAAFTALAILLLLALCACDSTPDGLRFSNQSGAQIHAVYVSAVDRTEWADPINYAKISNGSSIYFDFDQADGDGPGLYDLGFVDGSALNYDFYDVELAIGDTITLLPAQGEEGRMTVTAADGTVTEYEGYCYYNEE